MDEFETRDQIIRVINLQLSCQPPTVLSVYSCSKSTGNMPETFDGANPRKLLNILKSEISAETLTALTALFTDEQLLAAARDDNDDLLAGALEVGKSWSKFNINHKGPSVS
jgi:hypothetical protein